MHSIAFFSALLPLLVSATTPCTVGNNTPCLPSSTCTPTILSTSGKPWLGQCIATPAPQVPGSSTPVLSYPPVSMPTLVEPPPASVPSLISIPPVSMPTPVSMECNVGAGTGCGAGSTCTPTQTCYRLRPCGGKCIATPAPQPPASSTPIITYPPISMPSPVAECMVGWDNNGCVAGSTCEPIETCYRLRPCRGKCMPTNKTPIFSYPPVSMPSAISWTPVPMPTPVKPECSYPPVSIPSPISIPPVSMPSAISVPPASIPSIVSLPPVSMPTPIDTSCSSAPGSNYPPVSMPSPISHPLVSMPSAISLPPVSMPTPIDPGCSLPTIPLPSPVSIPPVSMPSAISLPPVSMPSAQPSAECMIGWAETGCKTGFSCEPVETCYRLRPCRGKCVVKVTSSAALTYPMPTATAGASSMVTCYR